MRRRLGALVLGLAVAAGACERNAARASGETAGGPAVVVVLVDVSGSVRDQEAIATYEDAFGKITESLAPGDVIAVGWISARSASEPRLPIQEAMPEIARAPNELYRKAAWARAERELAARREELVRRFGRMLEARGSASTTDILGALDLARRVFQSYPSGTRALVILSDMVQESSELSLKRRVPEGGERSALVRRLKREGRIPDLAGVRAWVVGARDPDPRRFRAIRSFWLELFHEAGATLREADYGGPLIRFDPHQGTASGGAG